jgi:hypothetical protein
VVPPASQHLCSARRGRKSADGAKSADFGRRNFSPYRRAHPSGGSLLPQLALRQAVVVCSALNRCQSARPANELASIGQGCGDLSLSRGRARESGGNLEKIVALRCGAETQPWAADDADGPSLSMRAALSAQAGDALTSGSRDESSAAIGRPASRKSSRPSTGGAARIKRDGQRRQKRVAGGGGIFSRKNVRLCGFLFAHKRDDIRSGFFSLRGLG